MFRIRRSAMITGVGVALALVFSPVMARDGALFVNANEAAGNEIVVYHRANDGQLAFVDRFSTGGLGSGPESVLPPGVTGGIDPLGSQGALALSADRSWLFAVNAGSNQVSVFKVLDGGRNNHSSGFPGLQLTGLVDSGGEYPVSVTVNEDLVYVLNAGVGSNITGFKLHEDLCNMAEPGMVAEGCLRPLGGSTRVLGAEPSSTPPVILNSPGQVLFDPDGTRLVVFVKGGVDFLPPLGFDPVEPAIHVFRVGSDGLPAAESKTTFADRAPFSGVFDREGRLFVAWVFSSRVNVTPPGIPVGGVSSYEIVDDPEMPLVPLGEDPVEVAEFGTCWIATDGKRYAYASNTLSNTITGFRIGVGGHGRSSVRGGGKPAFVGVDGSLHELDTDDTGVGPLDVALSDGGHYVYVLNGNPGTSQQSVSMFKINRSDGSLESIGEIQDGLPEGSVSAEGMVGY